MTALVASCRLAVQRTYAVRLTPVPNQRKWPVKTPLPLCGLTRTGPMKRREGMASRGSYDLLRSSSL